MNSKYHQLLYNQIYILFHTNDLLIHRINTKKFSINTVLTEFYINKLSLLPRPKQKIVCMLKDFDQNKRKEMLKNPKLNANFIKGVNQYRRQKYDQAAQYFVTSMTEQLHEDHEFTIKKQNTTKINDEKRSQYKKKKIFCGSLQSLLNLSCCLIKQKQYTKAQKICYRALQLNAYNSVPYYNLATINIKKENHIQALNNIKCALSCEYFKKYERIYNKKDLDMAIDLAPNNLSAIRYRVGFNSNLLKIIRLIGYQNLQTQASIYQQHYKNQKDKDHKQSIIKQLKLDIYTLKKFNRIYEIQFNKNSSLTNKQNISNNLYVSTIKPQLILQSKKDHQAQRIGKDLKQKLQIQLKIIIQLKKLRQQYLRLVAQNQQQINFQDIISYELSQKYINLLNSKEEKYIYDQSHENNKCQFDEKYENTVQTSFQLQDSYQTLQQPDQIDCYQIQQPIFTKSQLSTNKNCKNNQYYYEQKNKNKNKQQTLVKTNNKCKNHSLLNHNNDKLIPNKLSEKQYNLASSIMSIQDYQQSQITQYQHLQNEYHQIPQYKVNLIQSVIVPNQNHNKSTQLFQIQQNSKSYDYSLHRNRSCQSLVNNLLSPVKDLKKSQYQFCSRLTQSKSHLKLMSCSKCSIDHDGVQRQKNVNLQINLTQIYNYQCDFSELQTFCFIKHDGQQLKTETSKGKFPNWKDKIQFNVDFTALNQEQNQFQRSYQQIQQNRKVKIQLWAKRTHVKKDFFLDPNDLIQLIGQQEIDLREQKWTKRKIFLENKLNLHQKRKTAYMYVCLQKIKSKKV